MKKIYLSILSINFGLVVNAQTLTEASHSPLAGDMYTSWQCDSTGINPGSSGANSTWNFGSLNTHLSVVNNYTVVTNGTSSYPMPGVAIASSINNISYYNTNSTALEYWGGNITISGVNATITYSSGAIVASYPMSLNGSLSAVTGGTISIPALSQNGTFTGNSSSLADGTGTLILSTGVYTNVVRVVTSQTISFNMPIATGTITQNNYDYYQVGVRNSLVTISTATVNSTLGAPSSQTVVTRSTPNTVGIKENKQTLTDLNVYPNPANNVVNFITESNEAKQVLICDVTGKLIDKQNLTDGKLKLNVLDYNPGLYIYSVIGNNNQALTTGKITVSH